MTSSRALNGFVCECLTRDTRSLRGRDLAGEAGLAVPAQGVHDLRLGGLIASPSARRQRLASCLTHRVSVPTPAKPAPVLALQSIRGGELPDLG